MDWKIAATVVVGAVSLLAVYFSINKKAELSAIKAKAVKHAEELAAMKVKEKKHATELAARDKKHADERSATEKKLAANEKKLAAIKAAGDKTHPVRIPKTEERAITIAQLRNVVEAPHAT